MRKPTLDHFLGIIFVTLSYLPLANGLSINHGTYFYEHDRGYNRNHDARARHRMPPRYHAERSEFLANETRVLLAELVQYGLENIEVHLPTRRLTFDDPITVEEERRFFAYASFSHYVRGVLSGLRLIPLPVLTYLIDSIEIIEFTTDSAPNHGHNFAGRMDVTRKKLQMKVGPRQSGRMASIPQIRDTFIHELGHALHFTLPDEIQIMFSSYSWDLNRVERFRGGIFHYEYRNGARNFVSQYAATNSAEDFAETFEASIIGNYILQRIPEKLNFFGLLEQCISRSPQDLEICMF